MSIIYGRADSSLIEKDFTRAQRHDFTIRKEIIWESKDATKSEVIKKEMEFIKLLRSNESSIGYNQFPKSLS